MKRHMRARYYVVDEGVLTADEAGRAICRRPSTAAALRMFRFSRLGPPGEPVDNTLIASLAAAVTAQVEGGQPTSADPGIPAGFTYLAQFVDHDLTMDRTAVALGEDVTVDELLQGRSPALDLDSLYGRGPGDRHDRKFYADDGVHLKMGKTSPVTFPDARTNVELDGFDLPRSGFGSTKAEQRAPLIPDTRNDENLAIAQTHLAFIRFHNRVVDELAASGTPSRLLFKAAREQVVRHYQWMLRTDLLPRLVDPSIVDEVFTNGRRFFEVAAPNTEPYRHSHAQPGDTPTMPIEFSVAAYRLGHSMVRDSYQWNRVFNSGGPAGIATLLQLFTFTGVNGNFAPGSTVDNLDDPNFGDRLTLPTNWIVDFRRLYDFGEAGRADLTVPAADGNVTMRIDSLIVDPLANLPLGAFAGRGTNPDPIQRNLAFRNLARANMVDLASGQQMADFLGVTPLKSEQIIGGSGDGANLTALTDEQRDALTAHTPLWFYILREAEINGGRLTGVGGCIVAEVFHRAMEGSHPSIVRDPFWRPTLGPDTNTFRMVDLLLFAFDGKAELLNPLGDA